MHIREELQISKPLESGHEVGLALLLGREYVVRLFDQGLYEPEGISDQQYNVLRILKGGPKDGYLVKDIRCRMTVCCASCRPAPATRTRITRTLPAPYWPARRHRCLCRMAMHRVCGGCLTAMRCRPTPLFRPPTFCARPRRRR